MKHTTGKSTLVITLALFAMISWKKNINEDHHSTGAVPNGVHFKIAGKQYDVTVIRGQYDATSKTMAIYNAGLAGFPQTTISLSIGSNFTGQAGTFKSDNNSKGFVFGFLLFNGSFNKPIVAYGAGQNDTNSGETVASTPITLTLTSFSTSASLASMNGNITAQGTFSGTVYDLKNKTYVALTDGIINIRP